MKFNGAGIAAVVGPNGCGKSNLSDAISWVLGEQSAKSLRGARMEDVIFAGTREKKALGMASVTMTLVPDPAALAAASVKAAALVAAAEEEAKALEAAKAAEEQEGEAAPEGEAAEASTNGHHPENPENLEAASLDGDEAEISGEPQRQEDEAAVLSEPKIQQNALNGHHANGHSPIKADAVKTAERTGEITITRRLYRSGESEYLINGKTARLRDIQDLFLGTGLGPESYAIIEQGRIGQILSNKPQDRRGVIEEAAGITKFKTRKRLAEAKLEGAKQNLSRVFDILEEVTRQVNSLKRQAAKTKRYSELKTEATGHLKQLLAAKFHMLERETAKTAIELNLATNELQELQASIAAKETEQTSILEESYAVEQQLTEARKELSDLQLEAERVRGRLEYQVKQIEQIELRLSKDDAESQELARLEEEHSVELQQQIADLETLQKEGGIAQHHLNAKAAEREKAQNELRERERGLEGSRQQVLRLLGEASSLKNRVTQVEAQVAATERDEARAKAEEQQCESDLARIQQVKEQLSERLSAQQIQLTSVTDQRHDVEQEMQVKKLAAQETRQMVDRAQAEFSRIKARRDSLEEILSHRSYTTESVKRLFTAIQKGQANELQPVGVLADFLEVDRQFEKATEEFLHEELEYVVVKDWPQAERGIDLMRGDVDGRATFLVETPETGREAASVSGPEVGEHTGVLAKLSDTLRLTNGLSQLPLHLLPKLARGYVAKDRVAAQRLATEYPDCYFLLPEGVSYYGRAVSGGKKTGTGPLALKRELREMSDLEKAKRSELEAVQELLAGLDYDIASLTEQIETLRAQQQSQEKDVITLDHENRKLAEEFQRINTRLSAARLELERIAQDRQRNQEALERDRALLVEKEAARTEQEQALEEARGLLAELQSEAAKLSEEHATLRTQLAGLEERHRSGAASRARLESRIREFQSRRENIARETQRLAEERVQLTADNEELATKRAELGAAMQERDVRVQELARRESELRGQLSSYEEELKTLRANSAATQENRTNIQMNLVRFESDLKHLEETSQNELATTLKELSEAEETVPDEEGLAEIEQKYQELRAKIEALGPVNPQALEEYEEAQQRQDFLNTQRQDLLDSIRDIEKMIQEIDVESRKRFAEAFEAININFREMFKTLFGGGIGEMRLNDEENIGETGIDIVASPPGKRLQSVLLLSGGEKSLTAMALLMAIFQYTPSPFCILDEVDAPLDEPNIERLTRLLRDMSEQTQFIVITHSKRTMESAQSLYGVTMQEPGVSKLVSVKMGGAEEKQREKKKLPELEAVPV